LIPPVAAGHTLPIISSREPEWLMLFVSIMNSFCFDYVARQKVAGNHLTFGVLRQLAVPPPTIFHDPSPWEKSSILKSWIYPRVIELSYTAYDMEKFARDR